jgi:hypothetical protein
MFLGKAEGGLASSSLVCSAASLRSLQDECSHRYDLAVEYIGPLPGVGEVMQVVVRLPDNVVGAPRDLSVKVGLRGAFSNKAISRIAAT